MSLVSFSSSKPSLVTITPVPLASPLDSLFPVPTSLPRRPGFILFQNSVCGPPLACIPLPRLRGRFQPRLLGSRETLFHPCGGAFVSVSSTRVFWSWLNLTVCWQEVDCPRCKRRLFSRNTSSPFFPLSRRTIRLYGFHLDALRGFSSRHFSA